MAAVIIGRDRKDFTNKRFGNLVVVARVPGKYPAVIECLCDCGETAHVRWANLQSNHTKSCGCLRNLERGPKYDLTGTTVGLWEVLELAGKKGKHLTYLCRCACGTESIVLASNLRDRKSLSCGCQARQLCSERYDLSGRRFRKLTVLRRVASAYPSKKTIYECRCDCGTILTTPGSHLHQGKISSCGCGRVVLDGAEAAIRKVYGNYRKQAELRGYPFGLSQEEFVDVATQPCEYCGRENSITKIVRRKNGPDSVFVFSGVDRKDNTRGYEVGNCVAACFVCNRAKMDMSYEDFTSWISRTFTHLKETGQINGNES